MSFGTVAILGPGLIGGSLALALAERDLADKLVIYARSARALDAIRTAGVDAELTDNPSEAVREADIVVLCVPIEAMAGLVKEFREALKPTALVTDVGSVKASVDHELAPLLEGHALWIGSHPMAGSEQVGFSAARADLFEGAAVIITPTKRTQRKAQKRAEIFWEALGARISALPPKKHDFVIAKISHLPHLVAAALVNHVGPPIPSSLLNLAGGGFRDTTRVAAGSPALWAEIILANRDALVSTLDFFEMEIGALRDRIKNNKKIGLLNFLQAAHDIRSKLNETNPLFKKR